MSELDVFSGTVEILIDGLEPSDVVMGVGDNMDCLRSISLVLIVFFWVVMMELAVVHSDTS